MIRSLGVETDLHLFSNFKYVRSPCYLVERGHLNAPLLVGHFW
jgi:hypothetical protein